MKPSTNLFTAQVILMALFLSASFGAAAAQAPQSVDAALEPRERFRRAIERVDAGDLPGGLSEFHRLYELKPVPVIACDIGILYTELQRPAEAVLWLSRALKVESELDADKRERARTLLAQQRMRVGRVRVKSQATEGSLEIDNVEVAALPLTEAIAVASGSHVVGIVAPGFAPGRREVMVAGERDATVEIELVSLEGRLAHITLHSPVPALEVRVDGELVGRTPLQSSIAVAPGTRTVELSRPGYLTAKQSITLDYGADAQLNLTPVVDTAALGSEGGELQIEPSEPISVATIDGVLVGTIGASMVVPHGRHHLRVERGGFIASEVDIDLPRGTILTVPVALVPTASTRAAYIERTRRQRRLRGAMLGVTGLAAVTGAVLAALAQHALPDERATLRAIDGQRERGGGGNCDPSAGYPDGKSTCDARLNSATSHVDGAELRRTIGLSLAGVGLAGAITSAVLLFTADHPDKYERKSGASRLRLAPSIDTSSLQLRASGVW